MRLGRHLHQDVAFGEDAGEPVVLHDQNARAPLLLHLVNHVGESGRGGKGQRRLRYNFAQRRVGKGGFKDGSGMFVVEHLSAGIVFARHG